MTDCTEEHTAEVYVVTDLAGDEYRGDRRLEREAIDICVAAFDDYVGLSYEESVLDFFYFAPVSPDRWSRAGPGTE